MCNRYAADIRKAGMEEEYYGFDEWSETRINPVLGNAVLEVFPKSVGPVIVNGDGGALVWKKMRWGIPGPPQFGAMPVTNIRNIKSAHWRPLLGPSHRCLAPFTAFSSTKMRRPRAPKLFSGLRRRIEAWLSSLVFGEHGAAIMAPRKSPMSASIYCLAS